MVHFESICIEFDVKHLSVRQCSLQDLPSDFIDDNKIYWMHCDLNQQSQFEDCLAKLKLSEQVVRAYKEKKPTPILIDTDEALTIKIQCLLSSDLSKTHHARFGDLIIHLTHHFCFTASYQPLHALFELKESAPKAIKFAKTPCFILFLLLDSVVNDYSRILFNYEVVAEKLDVSVHKTHKNNYDHVMGVKQQVMKIKRHTIAIREILMRIAGKKISVISDQCQVSLSNLSNHTHMVVHESDSIRDILNGLLDQIENTLMQRLNETMRVLTAFAAIFLPLTLITGIYGMNFHWMPELDWKYGYFWALSLIILCAVLLLYIFKRRHWF